MGAKRLPRHLRNEDLPTDTFTPRTYQVIDVSLTLKAPNKNCSRRHFNFLLLSLEENKA